MKKMGKEVIGIIAANNIRISPYIFFYTNILESLKVKYELIYPDRNNYIDSFSGKAYKIEWNNKIPSAVNYALYARKVINIVNRRKYSKLIVLTSINATYLSLWLKRKYNRKFVVDIRDYTYENLIPYAFLEKIAFYAAGLRIISSERFKEFLPNNMDYLVCHNISIDSETRPDKWKKQHGIITIGYIGSVAYAENAGKLIKLVRNDKRFKFHIYGMFPEE